MGEFAAKINQVNMRTFISELKDLITKNQFLKTFITIGIFSFLGCILYYLGKNVGELIAFFTNE